MEIAGPVHFTLMSLSQGGIVSEKQISPFLLDSELSSLCTPPSAVLYTEKPLRRVSVSSYSRGQHSEERRSLGFSYKPGPFDVICAKGNAAKEWSGNRRFRVLIEINLPRYCRARKCRTEKSTIVTDIVDAIKESSPQGGFIQLDCHGQWVQVSDHHAREKIGQCFRDRLHAEYKSASKAKIRKRKMEQDTWSGSLFKSHGTDKTTVTEVEPRSGNAASFTACKGGDASML